MAQDAPAEDKAQVEKVTVTAQKRARDVQEVPISVTALTRDAMHRRGINDFSDVARTTPGLQYGDFGDLKLSPTSLRGIVGGAGSAGTDPAVGFYVDEVYVGQGVGADLDLYDIERVEVLRGPQGTLFGRNTIGGVISITTRRPSDELEISGTGSIGDYDSRRFGALISGPIIGDSVLGKISGIWDKRDGYEHNVLLGRDVNDHNSKALRGGLLFLLDDVTELTITGGYREVDQEPLVFETRRYNMSALLPNLLAPSQLNTDPFDRNVYSDDITEETLQSYDLASRLTTTLGEVKITNVLGYHEHEYYSRTDTDRSPLRIAYDGDPEDVWRFSEEFRVDFSTGPVDWLAGVYYFRQHTNNQSFIEVGADLADLFGDPSLTGFLAGSNAVLDTKSAAAFASATLNLSDALDVTAGARYTRDEKKIHYTQSDPLGLLGGDADIIADDSWAKLTPNFNARYRVTDDIMAYVSAAQGFKSGGFNDALGDANGISFDPESLWNYEAGLKTTFFDRRLVLNGAAYYMDWSEIQITIDNPATAPYDPTIINAGAAHSMGIELEAQALPLDNLLLGANLSIQEAKYDEGTLPSGQPLRTIPFAPNYTGALNAEWTLSLGDGFNFVSFGEVLFRGRSYLTADNQADGRVDPYQLVNLRFSLGAEDSAWRVAAFGKNITDEVYVQRLFDLSNQDLVGQKLIVLGDPATYGIEISARY